MAILEENQAANKALTDKQSARIDSFVEAEDEVANKVDALSVTLVDHINKYDANVKADLEDKAEQLKTLFNSAEAIDPKEFKTVNLTPVYVLLVIMIIVNLFVLYRL